MRLLSALVFLLPVPALADSFTLQSKVTEVTVYPQAAKITRSTDFSLPAGRHSLILPNLPASADVESLRVEVEGVCMGAVTLRENYYPSYEDLKTPDVQAARDKVEAIELQIEAVKNEAAQVRLMADAAKAQIGFLGQIGTSDDMATAGVDTLRDLSRMIAAEALAASQSAHNAQVQARRIERQLDDLQEDLDIAENALNALIPDDGERTYLSVSVQAGQATKGTLRVTYYSGDAEWMPVYDMYLSRGDAASLRLERGVLVRQDTGENWQDVKLTLSTVLPTSEIEPSALYTRQRFTVKPEPPRPEPQYGAEGSLAEPVIEAPVIVEQSNYADTNLNGYAVTYGYPVPVSIATGYDAVRLRLDTLTTGAEVLALAIPMWNDTAFLMAKVVNDTGEVLLPSRSSSLFVDDVFVGISSEFPGIPAGDKADLPFGPIDGLRLKRVVLNRNEGDRGIISRSNEQTETVEIEIRNLTNDTWPLRVLDRVPYSEQEDLQIDWSATPKPDKVDVENRRGILGWDFTLSPGDRQTIRTLQTLTWPDGMELR
jgi:uncharacterized protein (TIGR02231 family)